MGKQRKHYANKSEIRLVLRTLGERHCDKYDQWCLDIRAEFMSFPYDITALSSFLEEDFGLL